MVRRISATLAVLGLCSASRSAGQDPMPNPQQTQMQVQEIAQQRPREAEAAARAWLQNVGPDLIPFLDTMKVKFLDEYWQEVAQLTVQFNVFQNIWRRDTVRAQLVGRMFGLEAHARTVQRLYRVGSESQRTMYRSQLETLIGEHFDLENQLRVLEMKDIERRLADVRAETQRRLDKRAEFIKFAVDDIIRDAIRPR